MTPTQNPTAADLQQQKDSIVQLKDWANVELPAMGYEIQQTKQDPGKEAMAGDRASASARENMAGVMKTTAAADSDRLALPGSGSAVSHEAGILTKGVGRIGEAQSAGTLAQGSADIENKEAIIGQGNQMLRKANQALVTAGGVSDSVDQAKFQADQQSHQEAASLGMAALTALV